MKIKDLIAELQKLNAENDLFVLADDKLLVLEEVRVGQFFQSTVLAGQVEFDVVRAEQTLLSALQFQPDQLQGSLLNKIERAIGADRVKTIADAFNAHLQKQKEEEEKAKPIVEKITEEMNSQTGFEEEKPKAKKTSKKKVNNEPDHEQILIKFYQGDKSINLEDVRTAKQIVGEARAKELFSIARSK